MAFHYLAVRENVVGFFFFFFFFFFSTDFFCFLLLVCQRYPLVRQEHFSWQMSDGAFLAAVAKVQAESEPGFVCP
jgi:hypothetical protein